MTHQRKLLILLILLISGYAQAVNIQIIAQDGHKQSIPIDSIAGITFAKNRTDALILTNRQNEALEQNLTEIKKIVFAEPASIVHRQLTPAPSSFILHQNYPNPFNPETTIAFELASPGWVSLRMYNISGQLVTPLAEGVFSEGVHQVRWNGRDSRGYPVSPGVYFYEMKSCAMVQIKKCLFIE
jgi:hypothetical protein